MALRRRIVWRFSDIIISSKILIRHRASRDEHAGVHPNSDGGLWGKHNMIWVRNSIEKAMEFAVLAANHHRCWRRFRKSGPAGISCNATPLPPHSL
jgi:hypothetical protein